MSNATNGHVPLRDSAEAKGVYHLPLGRRSRRPLLAPYLTPHYAVQGITRMTKRHHKSADVSVKRGVAYGARTHNLRSHNPMLCQIELRPPRTARGRSAGRRILPRVLTVVKAPGCAVRHASARPMTLPRHRSGQSDRQMRLEGRCRSRGRIRTRLDGCISHGLAVLPLPWVGWTTLAARAWPTYPRFG